MNKLFVSHSIAKQLKEKKFYVPCMVGVKDGEDLTLCGFSMNNHSNMHDFALPMYQQVVDWFREKHDIHIIPHAVLTKKYFFTIERAFKPSITTEELEYYEAYNKAIEEALKLI